MCGVSLRLIKQNFPPKVFRRREAETERKTFLFFSLENLSRAAPLVSSFFFEVGLLIDPGRVIQRGEESLEVGLCQLLL